MNYLEKLLNLQDFVIEKCEEEKNGDETSKFYVYCHARSKGMFYEGEYASGHTETRIQEIKHGQYEDKQIILMVKKRRFFFPKTKKRVWEVLPNVDRKQRASNDFRKNVLKDIQKSNYSQTARKRGISSMSVIRLLDGIDVPFQWHADIRIVGIDGKGVKKGELVHTFTDIGNKKPIAVIPDLKKAPLIEFLKSKMPLEDRILVREFHTDMDPFYVSVCKDLFPNAHHVVDHFHVIQWAQKLLVDDMVVEAFKNPNLKKHKIRHIIRKASHTLTEDELEKLEAYFKEAPIIKQAWKIIHQLRKVYWQDNYKKARKQLRYVLFLCDNS